jgi:hypothetical protein
LSFCEDNSSKGRVPQNQDSQSHWLRVGLKADLIPLKNFCHKAFTIIANCEGSQSPPNTVELRRKRKRKGKRRRRRIRRR